jgi:hypothetical protein
MVYPKINDDWIFRETFDSVSSAIENGATTFTGSPTIDKGFTGDGSSDVRYADDEDNRLGVSEYTIICTINATSLSDFDGFVSKSSGIDGTHIGLGGAGGGDNDDIYCSVNTGSGAAAGYSTGDIISTGTSYHCAMVFDGGGAANADRLKLYIDGSEQTLTFSGTIPATRQENADDIILGANISAAGREFDGTINDVRIYNRALSEDEINDIYNSGNDDITFSEINDSRALLALPLRSTYDDGNNNVTENIGSLGGTVDVDSGVTQLTPRGMNFPGTNNTLVIGTSASYPSGASARTVFLILETTEITGQTRFGGWGSSGSFGEFSFGVDTDTTTLELSRYGGDFTLSGSNLPNGGIHSVAYAYDGTDVKGYVDGIKSGSNSTQALDTNNAGAAQTPSIGSRSGGTVDEFIGDMYVVLIYDFELTPTQIKYLHNKYMRLLNK